MKPPGFREDPFVYPEMSCHNCGTRFQFIEPFQECDAVECVSCHTELTIPPRIVEVFLDNISFRKHIEGRTNRQAPPPAN